MANPYGRLATRAVADTVAFAGGLLLTGNPATAFEAAQTADKAVALIPDDWITSIADLQAREKAGTIGGTAPVPSIQSRYVLRTTDGGFQSGSPAVTQSNQVVRHMVGSLNPMYGSSPPAVDLFGFAQARSSGLPYTTPSRIGVQVTAR